MIKLLTLLISVILLMSCNKDDEDRKKVVEMTIYPETTFGISFMSDIWTQTLKFSDTDDHEKRQLSDIIIEGFGFVYQKGYAVKYKLLELVSKELKN